MDWEEKLENVKPAGQPSILLSGLPIGYPTGSLMATQQTNLLPPHRLTAGQPTGQSTGSPLANPIPPLTNLLTNLLVKALVLVTGKS